MIKTISLNNFRSYDKAVFEFTPGINLLVGSSNRGKSTVFRALKWVLMNRPLGKSVVSYWNRDNKGNPIDSTSVFISVDNHILKRERTADKNIYEVDSSVLSAFKNEVPEEIITILNMDGLNLQEQDETGFIISLSPGEAAKVFNRALKLDVIDDCFSFMKKEKRNIEIDLKHEQEEIQKLIDEKERINWIDEADCLLQKIENIIDEKEEKENKLQVISNQIDLYYQCEDVLKLIQKYDGADKLIKDIEKCIIESDNVFDDLSSVEKEINVYKKVCKELKTVEKFNSVGYLVKEYETVINESGKVCDGLNQIENDIEKYKKIELELSSLNEDIEKIKTKLPDICPECGSILKGV